jgi:hypothetical protein
MTRQTLYNLAPPLIALQFLAFGWRVNRETHAAERPGVIPLPDVINIMSLFATVGCAISFCPSDGIVFPALANDCGRRLHLLSVLIAAAVAAYLGMHSGG